MTAETLPTQSEPNPPAMATTAVPGLTPPVTDSLRTWAFHCHTRSLVANLGEGPGAMLTIRKVN